MSHGDHVAEIAPGFEVLGTSPGAPFAITADPDAPVLRRAVPPRGAPHPERRDALRELRAPGRASPATGPWAPTARRRSRKIRDQVGDAQVICGLSGGVDSSVAAVLIHEAIGDQLTCVFVDHGLLRQNEADEVVTMFRDHYNMPLIHADETELFLGALDGVSDPETKRKTIGRLFIDVFQKHAERDRAAPSSSPRARSTRT